MKIPASAGANRNTTILLVDDDEDLLLVLDLKLRAEGYNTILSVNGKDVLELAKSARPDIVLLDITMQGVSGDTICKKLKEQSNTSTIPVILFSANHNIREIAATCGANGYVTKPLDFAAFRKTISALIPTIQV